MNKYFTKTEWKWAFIFMAVSLLWMIMERAMGWHDEHLDKQMYLTNLFAIPAIAIFVFALLDKRKQFAGPFTWKDGMLTGLVITLILTVFAPLIQYITSEIITPDYFKNVIEYSLETGYYKTREEAESNFNLQSYMIMSTVGTLGMGLITTAIVALFTRRK